MSLPPTINESTAALRKRLMGQLPSDRLAEPVHSGSSGVVRPETGTELSQIISAAMAEGLLLHPPGTEAPPKENFLELDLRRMSKILDLSPDTRSVTVQCGVLTGTIEQWLRVHGWTLGWYTPSLAEVPLAELIQDARAFLPGPTYKNPMEAVLGFHAILPDGREMWQKDAPARATGPDLLSVLRGGFSFGVLTRISLSIFQRPSFEDETVVCAPSLSALLALGGRLARLGTNPSRLLITRSDSSRAKKTKAQWVLRAYWHQNSEEQNVLQVNEWITEAFDTNTQRHTDMDVSDAWGPGMVRTRCTLRGHLPDDLVKAMESSTNSWVIAFENPHILQIWPDSTRKVSAKDPVGLWIEKEHESTGEQMKLLTMDMLTEALTIHSEHVG